MGRISPDPTRWPPGAERRLVPAKSNLKPQTSHLLLCCLPLAVPVPFSPTLSWPATSSTPLLSPTSLSFMIAPDDLALVLSLLLLRPSRFVHCQASPSGLILCPLHFSPLLPWPSSPPPPSWSRLLLWTSCALAACPCLLFLMDPWAFQPGVTLSSRPRMVQCRVSAHCPRDALVRWALLLARSAFP